MRTILGIETSCDETSAAIVRDGKEIVSNVVASSAEMHVKSGGIIPERAAREQVKSILPTLKEALDLAFSNDPFEKWYRNLDAIAVTQGPGLIGSLLVGVETAKTLGLLWNKPVVPVNHLVAHLYANWLENQEDQKPPLFPAVALVVSGGHTDLVLMRGHGDLERIGTTRDDAAGEAFDKTARLLGLPYPGGPSISAEAEKFEKNDGDISIRLPRPMIEEKNLDFSFSGLKTAVVKEVNDLKANSRFDQRTIQELSFEVQEAITEVLVVKTLKAVEQFRPKSLLLAGGVSANKRLKERFATEILNQKLDVTLHVPPPRLSTDNAAYIAASAYYNYHPVRPDLIDTNPQMSIVD